MFQEEGLTCSEHHGQEGCVQSAHMCRLGGEHVVKAKVCHIEERKYAGPPQVHGCQLAAHRIRKVLQQKPSVYGVRTSQMSGCSRPGVDATKY